MPQNINEIIKLIEELRNKLHDKADSKPLTDPEVVKASQVLNRALDEYYKLLQQKKENQ